jgi:hypothetical protein
MIQFVFALAITSQPVTGFVPYRGKLAASRPVRSATFGRLLSKPVVVFDGCFDEDSTTAIKAALMKDDAENGIADVTRVIDRQDSTFKRSEVEKALMSFIDELGDDEEPSRYIEWWWRDEWSVVSS